MTVDYVGIGNDDGTNMGRSTDKLGFYGLTTPIVKPAITLAATAASSLPDAAAALAELQDVIASLGLVNAAE